MRLELDLKPPTGKVGEGSHTFGELDARTINVYKVCIINVSSIIKPVTSVDSYFSQKQAHVKVNTKFY